VDLEVELEGLVVLLRVVGVLERSGFVVGGFEGGERAFSKADAS